jgi:hypothetical protein
MAAETTPSTLFPPRPARAWAPLAVALLAALILAGLVVGGVARAWSAGLAGALLLFVGGAVATTGRGDRPGCGGRAWA